MKWTAATLSRSYSTPNHCLKHIDFFKCSYIIFIALTVQMENKFITINISTADF